MSRTSFEDELSDRLTSLADRAPSEPSRPLSGPAPERRRWLVPAVAAAVIVTIAGIGIWSLGDRNSSSDVVTSPDLEPGSTTGESTGSSLPPDFAGGVDGPVMFAPGPPSQGGDDALIEGALVRDGDCLFAGGGTPGARFAVLWPFGTTWDDDAQEVIAPDGTRIPVGSTFSAGGGYGSPETLQQLLDTDALAERADACAEGEFRELAHVQHSITVEAVPTTASSNELVIHRPGRVPLTIVFTAETAAAHPGPYVVTHQVGVLLTDYGYDAVLYEDDGLVEPCTEGLVCAEVAAPFETANGFLVRSWAPVLIPGGEPSRPTDYTVEGPGWTLSFLANYPGAPIDIVEVIDRLVFERNDDIWQLTTDVGADTYALDWNGTLIRPAGPLERAPWNLWIGDGCAPAASCIAGYSVINMAQTDGAEPVPVDSILDSLTE